jgi:predicted nucleic acid-binding Zn ribbon protein
MRCPFCGEKVKKGAVICRFCGSSLAEVNEKRKRKRKYLFLSILGLMILCILISVIASGIEKARIARDPVKATIEADFRATEKARPTNTKVPTSTRVLTETEEPTEIPTATPISDKSLALLVDGVEMNIEEATIVMNELQKVGITKFEELTFQMELQPLTFYSIIVDGNPATLSFDGNELFGVILGTSRVLYDRDAGGVLNHIDDYTYDLFDESFYIEYAQNFVKSALKTPSTAQFPGLVFGRNEYRISKDHELITVSSYVDAQNAFGAMIRSNFLVQFEMPGDGKVYLTYLELDGQVVSGSFNE